jgi:uncharacterized protein YndB with AHSA1/START domain
MIKRTGVVELAALLALVGLVGQGAALGLEQQRAFVEGELVVRLTMELPIAPEQFFDAWTTAEQLVEWFPSWAEMTVTEGGEYRFGWDGWDDQWTGTYVAVDRPNRIVFTWQPPAAVFPQGAYETIVTLTFEDLDGATRLVLEHGGFQGGAEMESHLEAWRGYLYNLRAFLLQGSSGG